MINVPTLLQSRVFRGTNVPERQPDVTEMPGRIRQTVRYVTASDGVRLACAESGAGMPLVKAATWLTHLEHDLDSPVWRHWMAFLTGHFRFVRYDERGCGMTEWDVRDLSLDRRVRDLETVIEAARVDEPIRTARYLARCGGLHCLRRAASGSRCAYGAVRRLRARRAAARRPRCRADLRGDHRAGQFVGQ